MKQTEVVCGIIFKDDQVFLARRKEHKSQGGKWEFPGGKVELNETYSEALSRELIEEIGMNVQINEPLGFNVHKYENETIKLIAFKCEFISANFKLVDHDCYEWVSPKNIKTYNLAEADSPFLKFI